MFYDHIPVYKVRWKQELMTDKWYQHNPAEQHLTQRDKEGIILNHLLQIVEPDSEVEVYEE